MVRKIISAIIVMSVSLILVGCGGGSSDSSSSGSSSSGSNVSSGSSSNNVQYNMCTKVSNTQAEVVCTVYDCDSDFDLEYSYNIRSNCETAAQYWLNNVSNGSSGSGTSSTSGSSGSSSWKLCGNITSTNVYSRCTQTSCESGYSTVASGYSSSSTCENDASDWRYSIVNNTSFTPSETQGTSDTGASGGSTGSSGSSGSGDVFIDRGSCFQEVFHEWGTLCGTSNSLQVKWRNTCSETLDLRYCMKRTNGEWSCGLEFAIQSGQTSSDGAWICDATGNVEWRGRSSDSSANFPNDH